MEILDLINLALVFGGLTLITLEIFLGVDSAFDLVLSGLSLVMAGILGFLFWNIWLIGVCLSILFLILYWALGRSFIHKKITVDTKNSNIDKIIGMEGKVKRIKKDNLYVVSVDGEEWSAESRDDLKVGDIIIVSKFNSNLLTINKLK